MKDVLQFAAMGYEDLARLALTGRLTGPLVWMALEGAGTFLSALVRGDVAGKAERERRAQQCAQCPLRVDKVYRSVGATGGTCGDLDAGDPERGTCGCRVTVTVKGRVYPAGKTWIASESCPRRTDGRPDPAWTSVAPVRRR